MASRVFNGNERATQIFKENGYTKVVYHQTVVVKFNSEEIILNSGGYQTYTTKHRMNQAAATFDLNYQVYQKDYEWFVEFDGQTFEFEDGMRLMKEGDVLTLGGQVIHPVSKS